MKTAPDPLPDQTLGTLQDLPPDYVAALRALNLVPLWPSLRAVLPPEKPRPNTAPTHWPYASLKPLLLQAGELTPIEKAERRVLVLANPGHTLEKMQASAAMYLGMQLLLPGEWAPSHRHTPNAVRMIVEGTGAYTTVDGQKLPMARGDLILTPTGLWHEHGHDGTEPVIWLDVLDLPLMHYLEVSYHVNGGRQEVRRMVGAGIPVAATPRTPMFAPVVAANTSTYPILRYPWQAARAALLDFAAQEPSAPGIQITYANPANGSHAENVLGYYALMLRPGETLRIPARSPACVFHVIEGAAELVCEAHKFHLQEADTACTPGYTPLTLRNLHTDQPSFLFLADEAPLHQKLGVYEVRG